ncbi:MAG: hypothetical protein WCJ84_04800 [Candidatus Peregrinibacteria bacterium]
MNSLGKLRQIIKENTTIKNEEMKISHPLFLVLPYETQKMISALILEVYDPKMGNMTTISLEKIDTILRIFVAQLKDQNCVDKELSTNIASIRDEIALQVGHREKNGMDHRCLQAMESLSPETRDMCQKKGVLPHLQKYFDEYLVIFGEEKYIRNILSTSEGYEKIFRIRIFHNTYNHEIMRFNGSHLFRILSRGSDWEKKLAYFEDATKLGKFRDAGFNGYHIAQIVVGADWEKKLAYFEDAKKLKTFKDAGFDASHIAQIVVGADWEKKLAYFEDAKKLKIFKNAGFDVFHIAQIVVGADWEKKLAYFDDAKKLKTFKDAGFNGYHLSQIVVGADWDKKLAYFEDAKKLKTFKDAGFNGYHLSQIIRNSNWEKKLEFLGDAENLQRLKNAGFEASHLSQIVVGVGWEEKIQFVQQRNIFDAILLGHITNTTISRICTKKDWRKVLLETIKEGQKNTE